VSQLTEWATGLSLTTDAKKLVGKAGIVPVRRLADRVGLTDFLGGALVRRDFRPVHDRGQVLVSAACAILLGSRSVSGIAVMRQAQLVLGHPASASTLYRTLDAIGPVELAKIASARAKGRSRVHDLLDRRPGGFPWIRVDGRALAGWTVLDIDASLVPAHSDKEGAEPNRKGYGLHPILLFLDNTDEHLVCRLRPGSAGANTACDHIEVCAEGLRQLPTRRRRRVLFRADGAGATREYLRWITDGGGNRANTWQYSVGWTREEDFWTQLAKVPAAAWTAALDARGEPREDAALVEITDMLDLTGWPEGLRIVVRREPVHPKYAKDLKPYELATGFRYQAPGPPAAVARRMSSRSRSCRVRHPTLEGADADPAAVGEVRPQPGLVHPASDRYGPAVVVPAPGPGRQTRQSRTGHDTGRTVRRPGQTHRPRPPPRAELRPRLACRPRGGQSLEPRPGPSRPRLTPTPPPRHPGRSHRSTLGPWKPTPAQAIPGSTALPTPRTPNGQRGAKRTLHRTPSRRRAHVNDRG
jgi:hypothetical protein